MKLKKLLCCLMVAALLVTSLSFAASAFEEELASTGAYYNQNKYENYAAKAKSEKNLGSTYSPSGTTFKVWAPEAKSVKVRLYTTGTDNESGAKTISTTTMTYNSTTGIWSTTLSGDHKNQYYTYLVERTGLTTKETQDPYAHAVGANGDRSMIVDLDSTDPDGWDKDQHVLFNNPGEAVVWEIHVRDFSISASSGVSEENRGKYLAFTEGDTTIPGTNISTCVDYLVEHNVNCVQLMPIEDFASVDETSDAAQFNWGYDPKNYNVPDGAYSSDPYDGNTRITEFKMLVQALHDRGISVVMDVVYNHTFVLEGSPLNLTTPKYYYRMSSDVDYHNGSGLNNVLSSEKTMTRKFISDSLCYWASEYHIDGFRFDLMGCHDYPSLQSWRTDLDKIDSRILMYGEPWAGTDDNGISNGAMKGYIKNLTRVGGFHEAYSDGLKGGHGLEKASAKGFVEGSTTNTDVLNGAKGVSSDMSGAKTNQLVNYTDNHDNLILFDKVLCANGKMTAGEKDNNLYNTNKTKANNTDSAILGQMKIALTSSLTSQGIPFTVAGTEFCRTKYGEVNSYRSPDNMNSIDWNRVKTYKEVADYYAGLAAIRKAVSAFSDNNADSVTTVSGTGLAYQITNNKSGQWNKVIVAMNNSSSAKSISLSGSWVVVANATKAGTTSLGNASGSYSLPAWSAAVLVDASSFGNYTQPAVGTSTLTVEHYTRDSASGSYSKVKTETAKYRDGQTYRANKSLAILFDHNFDKFESTSNATYGTAKAGTNVTVKFYYTRYITSGYLKVNFLNTKTNTKVKTTMKYHMRNGDPFSVPNTLVQGYELDTTKYPGGTIGVFDAAHPAEFNFYYKALTNTTTTVHYFKPSNFVNCLIYAYYTGDDGQIVEPAGKWTDPRTQIGMSVDTATNKARGETGWYVKTVNASSFYVMFHDTASHQVPGAGEQGYSVSGEAWIKDGIVQFNNTIVTSHIDLKTGRQLSADVTKKNTSIRSDETYQTTALTTLNRPYITPANANGFYQAGVTNVVYLYQDENQQPTTEPATQGPTGETHFTFAQFKAEYDKLSSALDNYPAETYGNDPYYQAAVKAKNDYAAASAGSGSGTGGALMGDVDLNNVVEIIDATHIQRALAHLETLSAAAEANANVDGDKVVSITDVTYIQCYLAHIDQPGNITGSRSGGLTQAEIDAAYIACEKAYNDLSKIQAPTEPETEPETEPYSEPETSYVADNLMYMIPSAEWKSDGARFAAYFFDDATEEFMWVNMKRAGDGVYSVVIPDGYNMIIFVRMNGATADNNWENKWNQTDDLVVEAGSTYTVNGWEKS